MPGLGRAVKEVGVWGVRGSALQILAESHSEHTIPLASERPVNLESAESFFNCLARYIHFGA